MRYCGWLEFYFILMHPRLKTACFVQNHSRKTKLSIDNGTWITVGKKFPDKQPTSNFPAGKIHINGKFCSVFYTRFQCKEAQKVCIQFPKNFHGFLSNFPKQIRLSCICCTSTSIFGTIKTPKDALPIKFEP